MLLPVKNLLCYELLLMLTLPSLSVAIQFVPDGWHLRVKHARHLPFQLNAFDQQLKIYVTALEVFV